MGRDIRILQKVRNHAWVYMLMAGMLLGGVTTYSLLNTMLPAPDTTTYTKTSYFPAPYIYLDDFTETATVHRLWQVSYRLRATRMPEKQAAHPIAHQEAAPSPQDQRQGTAPSVLSQLWDPIAPVQTAQASATTPPTSTEAKAEAKADALFPESFYAGSLGQMAQLRAELEQLKMQVTIEETRARLHQIRGTPAPIGDKMPSLEFPPIGLPGRSSASLRILSIQSVHGKYTATVATPSGTQVVKVEDAVGGGRVVSITRNSVIISRGQGNETLTLQD